MVRGNFCKSDLMICRSCFFIFCQCPIVIIPANTFAVMNNSEDVMGGKRVFIHYLDDMGALWSCGIDIDTILSDKVCLL